MLRWEMLVLLFLFFQRQEVLVIGLRLESVWVPGTGLFGQSVTLQCAFNLESDQLLSVKWYKDEHEFFSYYPQKAPAVQRYDLPGVFVQPNSTVYSISLANLTLETEGNYKCEVSAERPSYRTLSRDGNLSIVVPPDPESPRISNFPSAVRLGESISGNCTSFRSRPPANLTFYINSIKASNPEVTEYRPLAGTWERGGHLIELYTSVIGLKFTVGNQHFRQGVIKLRCSANVGHMTKVLSTDLVVRHQNFPDQFSTGTGTAITLITNSCSRRTLPVKFLKYLNLFPSIFCTWITLLRTLRF